MLKNNTKLLLLFSSHIISGLSSGISMIAIPWYFTNNLNLNSLFSVIFGSVTLVGLFWGLYSGTIIDKYNRKIILEKLNFYVGLIIFIFSFLIIYINSTIISTILIALIFSTTCFYYIIYYPTLYAFSQEISEKKNYVKINSYIEIVGQSTTVAAGGLAAILLSGLSFKSININPLSIEKILLIDSITFLIGSLIISKIKFSRKKNKRRSDDILKRLYVGIKFLKSNKLILIFGICSHIIFAFILTELFTLLPLLIKNFFTKGAYVFAITDLCYAVGALFSGFFVHKWITYIDKIRLSFLLIIFTSISILVMISNKSLVSLFTISIILGLSNSGVRILRNSFLFDNVPNDKIGRVISIFVSINTMIRVVLIFVFSYHFFSEKENVIYGYVICSIILFFFSLPIIYFYKQLKRNCII
tara:strand:+ start:30007 stop:31254 length:1248 start_codon:yes stop_codon:yes gene_type:complete